MRRPPEEVLKELERLHSLMTKKRLPENLRLWVEAGRKFRLSHAHVQMARELGLNPKKLGSIANDDQEPWKAPLPIFLETPYLQRFGKSRPDRVLSIAERAREIEQKKQERRQRKLARRQAQTPPAQT